jgi:predicted outer membrane protein
MRFRSPAIRPAFIAGALWLSAAAFAADAPAQNGPQSGAAAPAAPESAGNPPQGAEAQEANPPKPTDGGIVSAVMAYDSNIIAASDVAYKKKLSKEAKSFAHILHDQHVRDLEKYKKLIKKQKLKPTQTAAVRELRAKGAEDAAALSGKEGKEFENAYVESMAKSHAAALELYDRQLIPNAQNEALKKQLTDSRAHDAVHLEKAKRLQANVASKEE